MSMQTMVLVAGCGRMSAFFLAIIGYNRDNGSIGQRFFEGDKRGNIQKMIDNQEEDPWTV